MSCYPLCMISPIPGLVRGQGLRGLGGGQEADISGEGHLHGEAARLKEVRHQRRQRPGVQGESS